MVDSAIEGESPGGRLSRGILPLLDGLLARFLAERDRWALWGPAGFGLGIALYFALPVEPWTWLGLTLAVPLLGFALWARRTGRAGRLLMLSLPVGLVAAGFGAAELETWRVAAPVVAQRLGPVPVAGRVVAVEALPTGRRVTIAVQSLADWAPEKLPRFVRVKLDPGGATPSAGDHIAATVVLLPPPAPQLPGDRDFQRQAFFMGLGAVGYALGPANVRPEAVSGAALFIARLREAMTRRIVAALPGTSGAVASALITGEKGAIPEVTAQDFRDAGLAHLLVIAGLHMTLVTGCAFFLLRAGFALVPRIALRHPIKKWAALVALVLAGLYLIVSGAAVPTQRAFVMCVLGLIAILADRQLFSFQAVAWAAMLVLALAPDSLLGPSFQMSFAAVVCLVGFYETYGARIMALGIEAGPVRHFLLHLLGIAITTVVVTAGTAPFAIYHFNRFPVFSVVANVLAVPLSAFWIMPWALLSCLLMPLGLEKFGLVPMGWGIELVTRIAHWTAGLPGDVVVLPAMPVAAIAAVSLGGLWLALWRGGWRFWGVVPILIGMASLAFIRAPDLYVAADGRLAALRDGTAYRLSSDRADGFAAKIWLEASPDATSKPLPLFTVETFGGGMIDCRGAICLWHVRGHDIALIRHRLGSGDTCPTAELTLSLVRLSPSCRGRTDIPDPVSAETTGARAFWIGDTLVGRTTAAERGIRPWVVSAQ
jgi:competence protein ComEC